MDEQITIFGADTNIGAYVLYLLSKMGYRCIVPLFYPHRHSDLKFNDKVYLKQVNLLKTNELSESIKNSSKVFNFFRAYENSKYDLNQLDSYNHFFCKHLIQLCVKNKVKQLIHHSALGVNKLIINNPYWLSRSYGEKALLVNSSLQVSIVRSAWTYGDGVETDNQNHCFVKSITNDLQQKNFYPLIGKNVILSPIHIKSLAELFISLAKDNTHKGHRIIEAVGKDTLSLDDIVKKIHNAINSSTKLYQYPHIFASRLIKKNRACGAFFPLGTKNFHIQLTVSETKLVRKNQTIQQTDNGILDYIETNSKSFSLNEQYSFYRKASKR